MTPFLLLLSLALAFLASQVCVTVSMFIPTFLVFLSIPLGLLAGWDGMD